MNRGIEVVREQIKSFASTKSVFSSKGGFKLIVLDEADAMTQSCQGALRRVIEQYTKNVRFCCIICNYVNKSSPPFNPVAHVPIQPAELDRSKTDSTTSLRPKDARSRRMVKRLY